VLGFSEFLLLFSVVASSDFCFADMINAEQVAIAQQPSIAGNEVENGVEEVRGQLFSVGPRYVNLSYIGEGAYGRCLEVILLMQTF
jgi:hypothetical protein